MISEASSSVSAIDKTIYKIESQLTLIKCSELK
jgi:hypothetical protein